MEAGKVVVVEGQGKLATTIDLDNAGCLFALGGGAVMLARLTAAQQAATCRGPCALHLLDAQCVASLSNAGAKGLLSSRAAPAKAKTSDNLLSVHKLKLMSAALCMLLLLNE